MQITDSRVPLQTSSRSVARLSRYALAVTATAPVVIGAIWLIAWSCGLPQQWAATAMVTMKANMAVAVLVAGSALLMPGTRSGSTWRRVGATAATLVFALGALTLGEHLFHLDFGIDQLLFAEPAGAAATASPNRIGPPGALSLTLVGFGLLAMTWRWRIAAYVGVIICAINLVPAVGYLYRANAFYGKPQLTGIAWSTVIALMALGIGLVLARADSGPLLMLLRDDTGGKLLRHLLPATLLVPLVLGYFRRRGEIAGMFGAATGTALLVVSVILVFSALLWVSAARLSRSATAEMASHHALRHSEERFRLIFDRAGVGVLEVDAEDHFISANDRVCEILGCRRHEIFGRTVHDLTAPEDRVRSDELNAQLHEGRFDRFENEKRYLKRDGTPVWVHVTVSAVRDQRRQFLGAITTVEDITKRKEAEEEIAHLASFPQLNPNPIIETDLEGNISYANPAMLARFPDILEAKHRHPVLAEWSSIVAAFNAEGSPSVSREVKAGAAVFHQTIHNLPKPGLVRCYSVDITDHKRAEEEVAKAKERAENTAAQLRTVMDSMTERVYVCDMHGRPLLTNEAFRKFYGAAEPPVYPQSFVEAIEVFDLTGSPLPLSEWPLARAFRGEQVRGLQLRIRPKKNGQEFINSYNAAPVINFGGNVIMAVLTANDVTEHKRAEEALRQGERRLRRFYDSGMIGVFYWNSGGAITDANDKFLELTGYTREELKGGQLDWSRMTPPEYRELDEDYLTEVRTTGIHPPREKEYVRKNGTRLPIMIGAATLDDRGNEGVAFVIDISDRKRAEEALRESETRFRAMAENIPQMIWVADSETNFSYLSPKWLAYTGTTVEENMNGGWLNVIHPADRPKTLEMWNQAAASRGTYVSEYRVRRYDGEYRWHLSRAVPISEPNTNVDLWFGTGTDIHDQKQAQEALIRSEKLASVGRMAATIAHEINNPLAAAMNALFLASAGPSLPDSARRNLELADKELKRVAHITKQTLGFYRERAKPTAVDLAELVNGTLALYGPKLRNKSVSVERRFRSTDLVQAVEGELRQVVSNLLANSIDAVRQEGKLYVCTAVADPGHGQHRLVRFTIADNGEGISPENLKRVFEPFFTTKEAVGTGLGLWVTSELVKKHDGRIRMRSRVGKGTVVSIWLPADRQQQHEYPTDTEELSA